MVFFRRSRTKHTNVERPCQEIQVKRASSVVEPRARSSTNVEKMSPERQRRHILQLFSISTQLVEERMNENNQHQPPQLRRTRRSTPRRPKHKQKSASRENRFAPQDQIDSSDKNLGCGFFDIFNDLRFCGPKLSFTVKTKGDTYKTARDDLSEHLIPHVISFANIEESKTWEDEHILLSEIQKSTHPAPASSGHSGGKNSKTGGKKTKPAPTTKVYVDKPRNLQRDISFDNTTLTGLTVTRVSRKAKK